LNWPVPLTCSNCWGLPVPIPTLPVAGKVFWLNPTLKENKNKKVRITFVKGVGDFIGN
jgi:Tfp pilus assembly protein PilZ